MVKCCLFDFEDKEVSGLLGTGAVSVLRHLLRLEGINPELPNLLIFDEFLLFKGENRLRKIVPGLESQDSCSDYWIQS
ncbi:MAG: hypothetical protein KAW01_01010 [Deltaproteobacteria bacterium]|nr:hypothetical protein [Deltaproteobacteria bacterium]